MRKISRITYFILSSIFYSLLIAESAVRVFILAGQSNMEGKGGVDPLLNHQILTPETREFFACLHCEVIGEKSHSSILPPHRPRQLFQT